MIPSPGRIVHYTLSASDVSSIKQHRTLSEGGKVGNPLSVGDVYPMLIVRVWSDTPGEATAVQGQVFLDGNDSLWVTSRQQGDGEGLWREPVRVG